MEGSSRRYGLGAALWWYWEIRGLYAEARHRLERLVALSDGGPGALGRWRAHVLVGLGHFAGRAFHDFTAEEAALMESARIFQALGDRRGESAALFQYGQAVAYAFATAPGTGRRRAALERSLRVAREAGDAWQTAYSLNTLAVVRRDHGDLVSARRLLAEALALQQDSAIRGGSTASLSDLGHLHRLLGDEAAARAHYERSLALRRALGDTYGVATSLFRLGSIALVAGDDALARAYLEDSTALAERVGTVETALPQGLLGLLACEFGDLTRSQALLTEAVRRSDAKRWPASLALTLPLAGFARLAVARGQVVRALRLAGAATALCARHSSIDVLTQRTVRESRLRLDPPSPSDAAAVVAWAEGATMTPEEATAYALSGEPEDEPWPPPAGIGGAVAPAPSRPAAPGGLTAREREVAVLIAHGRSNSQIARELTVAPRRRCATWTRDGQLRVHSQRRSGPGRRSRGSSAGATSEAAAGRPEATQVFLVF